MPAGAPTHVPVKSWPDKGSCGSADGAGAVSCRGVNARGSAATSAIVASGAATAIWPMTGSAQAPSQRRGGSGCSAASGMASGAARTRTRHAGSTATVQRVAVIGRSRPGKGTSACSAIGRSPCTNNVSTTWVRLGSGMTLPERTATGAPSSAAAISVSPGLKRTVRVSRSGAVRRARSQVRWPAGAICVRTST